MNKQKPRIAPKEVPPTRNKSWRPGQKGQGGEGMSKGYGGSAGRGTGPSGPENGQSKDDDADRDTRAFATAYSVSLPSPEHIERVLR